MRIFSFRSFILFVFLVSCGGTPVATLPTPTSTPKQVTTQTVVPTPLPALIQPSQLSIQKVEKPSLKVDFGDIETLHGEYLVFKSDIDIGDRTPVPFHFRNYKYQAWDSLTHQGKLFDIRTDPTNYQAQDWISYSEIIHFDTQSNFWMITGPFNKEKRYLPIDKDQLFKLSMKEKKFEQYSFVSPCAVDINGNASIVGRSFSKRLDLDYFAVFLSECPSGEQNGVALFSLQKNAIMYFFPLGSPQYPTLYKAAAWLSSDLLAFVGETDTCVIRVSAPSLPCRKFSYSIKTLSGVSPDGKWFMNKGIKEQWEIQPLECSDRSYILCEPTSIDSARRSHITKVLFDEQFTSVYWAPNSLKVALLTTDPPQESSRYRTSLINVYDLKTQQDKYYGRGPGYVIWMLMWSVDSNKLLSDYGKWRIGIMSLKDWDYVEAEEWFIDSFFIP